MWVVLRFIDHTQERQARVLTEALHGLLAPVLAPSVVQQVTPEPDPGTPDMDPDEFLLNDFQPEEWTPPTDAISSEDVWG